MTGADHVVAVGDRQSFPLTVIGQQDADPLVTQAGDDVLNAVNRDRVDARKRLIKQDQHRISGETPRDFQSPPFAPR